MNDLPALFLIFLRAAALSVGGQGALPLLRQDLVVTGRLTEGQVLEALVVGRIAPGPTGLYVVTLGYFAAGPLGGVTALAAACLPPLAMVAVASALRRQLVTAWAGGIVRGVGLSASGPLIATAARLLAPDANFFDVPAWQLGLAAAGVAFGLRGRPHPGFVIAIGALAGLAFGR